MAVPKRKVPRSRRGHRRSNNSKMAAPAMSTCAKCGETKQPHRVCPNCGFYRGVDVLRLEK